MFMRQKHCKTIIEVIRVYKVILYKVVVELHVLRILSSQKTLKEFGYWLYIERYFNPPKLFGLFGTRHFFL